MLEIIKQENESREGNDCLIKDCYTILKYHDTYIVMNIRRYNGWCDNGLNIIGRREFDYEDEALSYYKNELRQL